MASDRAIKLVQDAFPDIVTSWLERFADMLDRERADAVREEREAALTWACNRWRAEVENRPVQNIHRKALDCAWRQAVRHFGGNDSEDAIRARSDGEEGR